MNTPYRRAMATFAVVLVLLTLLAVLLLNGRVRPPLLQTAQRLGPSAASLLQGRGLTQCADAAVPCYTRGSRMPVPPVALAALVVVSGNRTAVAMVLKGLLFAVPLGAVWVLAVGGASARPRDAWVVTALLLGTVALPPVLNNIANLAFEESYFASVLALGAALLFFPEMLLLLRPTAGALAVLLVAVFVYLSKSSMLACALALVVLGMWGVGRRHTPHRLRPALLLLLFFLVPLGWATRQSLVSGRWTTGTSPDWVNAWKGNNPTFLQHYPPPGFSDVDPWDREVLPRMQREWDLSDACKSLALAYVRTHPAQTLRATGWKAYVLFIRARRSGEQQYPRPVEWAFTLGLALGHTLVLLSIARALVCLRKADERFAAVAWLVLLTAIALPYLAGFALARHATVMVLPAAVYLCRWLRTLPQVAAVPANSVSTAARARLS